MAATIAHNVKNPLSSIKTLMQLQSEAENLTEDQTREFEMVTQEVDRLAKTVSNLLRFSSLGREAPRSSEAEEVNLEHLTASLRAVFRGDLDSKRLTLETRIGGDSPVVSTDGEALKDILSNLLSNAIDASPEGGKVWIDFDQNQGKLLLLGPPVPVHGRPAGALAYGPAVRVPRSPQADVDSPQRQLKAARKNRLQDIEDLGKLHNFPRTRLSRTSTIQEDSSRALGCSRAPRGRSPQC